MNEKEFAKAVEDGMKEIFSTMPEICVEILTLDERGETIEALGIRRNDSDAGAAIPLAFLYEHYRNGIDLINILSATAASYIERLLVQDGTWWEIKNNIYPRLITEERLAKRNPDSVYRLYDADLCIVYVYHKEDNPSIAITWEMLNAWGKAEADLYNQAFDNARNDQVLASSLAQYIEGVMYSLEKAPENMTDYVVTSHRQTGSAMLLLPNVRKQLSDIMNGPFYISLTDVGHFFIHSVTEEVMKCKVALDFSNYGNPEIVTDHIYKYDPETDEIVIAI